jgi:hypothetical protein
MASDLTSKDFTTDEATRFLEAHGFVVTVLDKTIHTSSNRPTPEATLEQEKQRTELQQQVEPVMVTNPRRSPTIKGREVSREAIEQALQDFDQNYRQQQECLGWEQKGNYTKAILYQDKQYPVKQIVVMASGLQSEDFITTEATRLLKALGFIVTELDKTSNISTNQPMLEIFVDIERANLVRELENIKTTHLRRREIGERLNEIGDNRPGVGVLSDGTPDIKLITIVFAKCSLSTLLVTL